MPTLLDSLLDLLEGKTGLRASFDDLSGISLDYPQLQVSAPHAKHCTAVCELAKSTPVGFSKCNHDKLVANRLAIRRRRAYHGQCYLGLLDVVEPLMVAGRVLGVFYYGSVRLAEGEAAAQQKMARYCSAHRLSLAEFTLAREQLAMVTLADVPDLQRELATVAQTVAELCIAWAAPVDRYQQRLTSTYWGRAPRHPPVVQAALAYVQQRYAEPCQVKDLARYFKCHPDYLSRVFQKHVGLALSDHVRNVRLERAKRMLGSTALGIGEIGAYCGFLEAAHFTRAFRAATGQTPGQYRLSIRQNREIS